jgi:peptidoglycan/LPS O-acetylase OafA/YrhL
MTAATYPGSDYRPDIDGLRAVAVLAVLGFHANLGAFRGGFVGVDIFFVISGYLITGLILSALSRGTFTFSEFYTRRINRIFPALLVVLAATATIGWTILFSREFQLLGKHIFGGAAFVSNVILWREAGYFDSPMKPLLHLWSLAVEEQFYLIWPLVAWLTWRWRRSSMPVVIGAVVAVSFLLSVLAVSRSMGSAAFYSPLTRFWQIMIGSLLIYFETRYRRPIMRYLQTRPRLHVGAAIFGIVLLLASLAIVDSTTAWPGWYALLPVAGAVTLIAAGPDNWISRKLLANECMVAIGLISYPLYLWHWPLIVFGRVLSDGPIPPLAMIGILALSFLLALATYQWVEKPIRFGNRKRRSARFLLSGVGAMAVSGLIIQRQLIHPRFGEQASAIEQAQTDWDFPGQGGLRSFSGDVVVDTIPGDPSRAVAFFGDSHIQQYWPRVVYLARAKKDSFPLTLFLTYGSCPPLPDVNRDMIDPLTKSRFQCDRFHRKAMRILLNPAIKTVVMGAYWELYLPEGKTFLVSDPSHPPLTPTSASTNIAFREMELEVRELIAAGKKVYILLSNPTSPAFDPRSMFANRLRGFQERKPVTEIAKADFISRSATVTTRLRQLAANVGATVIDPVDYLCDAKKCPTVSADGMPIYTDEQHLRASFARTAAVFIDSIFRKGK